MGREGSEACWKKAVTLVRWVLHTSCRFFLWHNAGKWLPVSRNAVAGTALVLQVDRESSAARTRVRRWLLNSVQAICCLDILPRACIRLLEALRENGDGSPGPARL